MTKEIMSSKDLHLYYGKKEALKGIDLSFNQGEITAMIGPSGCGKSTLIRCIASFEDYDGVIKSNGKIVTKPDTDRIMVFQDFNQLYPWRTVEKNIQFPLKLKGIKDKEKCIDCLFGT